MLFDNSLSSKYGPALWGKNVSLGIRPGQGLCVSDIKRLN